MMDDQEEAFDDVDESDDEEIEIPEDDIGHVKAGLTVLSRNLAKELKQVTKLKQEKSKTEIENNIGQCDEIIPRVLDDQGIAGLNDKQRQLADTGIGLYVVRLRAAKGTNRGIFRSDWATKCVEIADDVEARIKPQLTKVQVEMAAAE